MCLPRRQQRPSRSRPLVRPPVWVAPPPWRSDRVTPRRGGRQPAGRGALAAAAGAPAKGHAVGTLLRAYAPPRDGRPTRSTGTAAARCGRRDAWSDGAAAPRTTPSCPSVPPLAPWRAAAVDGSVFPGAAARARGGWRPTPPLYKPRRRSGRAAPLREKFPGYPATSNSADLTLTGEIFPSVGSKLTRRIPVTGALPSSRIQEKSWI